MPASAEFLDFLKEQMADFAAVTPRRMFGGAGLFRDGLMFALVSDDVLYLKSDAQSAAAFAAENLLPFAYAAKHGRRTIMSYHRAPERCLDDPAEMTQWCRIAWDATLRARPPKRSRNA